MDWLKPLFEDIDLPSRFSDRVPPLVTKLIVAGNCLGTAAIIRALLDLILPGVAPMALVFPPLMMATLFGGLLSGIITLVTALLWAWFVVMPVANKSLLTSSAGASTLIAVTIIAVITLLAAYVFREAVVQAQRERNRQIADRDLFLHEFDHRVKNNFAIVLSLLDLQRRRADPVTAEALGAARARIEGIARAHQHLYRDRLDETGTVAIAAYLNELCAALNDALNLADGIRVVCDSAAADVPRDRAVSIGLIVNELVTNAAKHAFVGRGEGTIRVGFKVVPQGWIVTVADNGVGIAKPAPEAGRRSGLGTRLVDAFARQANGKVSVKTGADGTCVTLDIAA